MNIRHKYDRPDEMKKRKPTDTRDLKDISKVLFRTYPNKCAYNFTFLREADLSSRTGQDPGHENTVNFPLMLTSKY